MRDSIIINMKYAEYDLIDGKPGVHRHHCLMGQDREKADEDGLWVPLSPDHHENGKISAHHCKEMKVLLQIIAQLAYEKHQIATTGCSEEEARELFRKRYFKSYL